MVRNYQRKTNQQKWLKAAMKEAVAKVRNREITLTEASDTYSIPKTTLFRRARKDGEPCDVAQKGLGRFRPVFNLQQDNDLADYILFMESFVWVNTQGILTIIIPICYQKPHRTSIQYGIEDGRRGFCVRLFETSPKFVRT